MHRRKVAYKVLTCSFHNIAPWVRIDVFITLNNEHTLHANNAINNVDRKLDMAHSNVYSTTTRAYYILYLRIDYLFLCGYTEMDNGSYLISRRTIYDLLLDWKEC